MPAPQDIVVQHFPQIHEGISVDSVTAHGGDGGIKMLEALQQHIKSAPGFDPNHLSELQQHILSGDATKLAQEYGLYDPAKHLESARIPDGSTLGFDADGHLVYTPNGGAAETLSAEHGYEQSGGAMAHSPVPGTEHAAAPSSSTSDLDKLNAQRVKVGLKPIGTDVTPAPHDAVAPSGAEASPTPAEAAPAATPDTSLTEIGVHGHINSIGTPIDPDITHGYLEGDKLYAFGGTKNIDDIAQAYVSKNNVSVFVDKSTSFLGLKFPQIVEYAPHPGGAPAMIIHHDLKLLADPEKFSKRVF